MHAPPHPDAPLCPSCGQPASVALAGPEHGWECRNEACAEFGQAIDAHEAERPEEHDSGGSTGRP